MRAFLSTDEAALDCCGVMTIGQAKAIVAAYHDVFSAVAETEYPACVHNVEVLEVALRVLLDAEAAGMDEGEVVYHAADAAWNLLGSDCSDETNERLAAALIESLQVELCAAYAKRAVLGGGAI